MKIENVLAGVAVKDLDAATAWYDALLGAAGKKPMAEVTEWKFPRGGGLQVFADAARAGHSSITLIVANLGEQLTRLEKLGVKPDDVQKGQRISLAFVTDPAGNRLVLAEVKDDEHLT